MSDHFRFISKLLHELGGVNHDFAAFALRRLPHLDGDQAELHMDPQCLRRQRFQRLSLRLHDIGQRSVTRLVPMQLSGD